MSIKDFVPMEKLGEGSFASVFKVRRLTDQKIYAIKKIKMGSLDTKSKNNALNQVRILASISSPYIVSLYEAFFDESIDALCIVMEYADGGDLGKVIKKYKNEKKIISEIEIWKVLIHLLNGLNVLHQQKILHRDLKSQNIFITNSIYKIGDLNVSKVNKSGLAKTQTGTPYYASPQVWNDQPYDEKCDIWSLGCILYEMAALKNPFSGQSMHQLFKNIKKGQIAPIPKCYSNELADVIKKCLTVDANLRPSAKELRENWTVKMYENICIDYKIPQCDQSKQLLQTIKMPENKRELKDQLPKSNYKEDQKLQLLGEILTASPPKLKKQTSSVSKSRINIIISPRTSNYSPVKQNKDQPIIQKVLDDKFVNILLNQKKNVLVASNSQNQPTQKKNADQYQHQIMQIIKGCLNKKEHSYERKKSDKPKRILKQIASKQKSVAKNQQKSQRSISLPRTQRIKEVKQEKKQQNQSQNKLPIHRQRSISANLSSKKLGPVPSNQKVIATENDESKTLAKIQHQILNIKKSISQKQRIKQRHCNIASQISSEIEKSKDIVNKKMNLLLKKQDSGRGENRAVSKEKCKYLNLVQRARNVFQKNTNAKKGYFY